MACTQVNRHLAGLQRMRELAKKAAKLDGRVFVLYEKQDGTFAFCSETEKFTGKLIEYIYY